MSGAPHGEDRRVRLTPPPRVTRPPRRPGRRGGVPPWLWILVLTALATAAYAVLVELPRWMGTRGPAVGAPVAATEPAEAVEPTGSSGSTAAPLPAEAEDPTVLAEQDGPNDEGPSADGPMEDGRTGDGPTHGSAPTDSGVPGGGVSPDPADADFRAAMSEGLVALDTGDWAAARTALERARSIRSDAPEIADALARVRTGETLARIADLRQQAQSHEEAERWRDAVEVYRQVLGLDAAVAFAREGERRAGVRAELAETLDRLLGHPGRLSSAAVLEEAAGLLERARQIEPAGPRHRRQIDELTRLLSAWSQPVTAALVSDARTRVTVYRVGRLGAFERRELELRPGTYTVVGHRDGYRDVRHELVIRPGEPPEPLRVVCEEEI